MKDVELVILVLLFLSGITLFSFYINQPIEFFKRIIDYLFFALLSGYVIGKLLREA